MLLFIFTPVYLVRHIIHVFIFSRSLHEYLYFLILCECVSIDINIINDD